MVHGTADDNVHYQQSMMLARAMEEADVLFRSYSQFNEGNRASKVFRNDILQAIVIP